MSGFESRLAEIRERFVLRARADATRIAAIDFAADATPTEVVDAVHKLAGLAGTLGYAEVSAAASRLERSLLAADDRAAMDRDRTDLLAAIAAI